MSFLIRRAAPNEAKTIQNITRHFKHELPFVMLPQIQSSIEAGELFVAEVEQQIVGFVRFHTRKDAISTLYDLAVLPHYQKTGIGSALVFSVPAPIQLRCTVDNPANRFYRRLGFRKLSTEQGKKQALNLYRLDWLLVYIRGADKLAPETARIAGIPYGIRNDYYPYADPLFLDIHWTNYDWNDYCQLVSRFHPIYAMVPDYEHPSQKERMLRQIEDLKTLGVLRVGVCPKFEGAVKDIPMDCVLAISVPTQYAGFLPNEALTDRKIHLLGGHPDQWMYLIRYRYPKAHFLSMDGNIMGLKAGLRQYWHRGWNKVPDGIEINKTRLAALSFRNARRELLNTDPPRLTSSRRVLRCAIHYTPLTKPTQIALFD